VTLRKLHDLVILTWIRPPGGKRRATNQPTKTKDKSSKLEKRQIDLTIWPAERRIRQRSKRTHPKSHSVERKHVDPYQIVLPSRSPTVVSLLPSPFSQPAHSTQQQQQEQCRFPWRAGDDPDASGAATRRKPPLAPWYSSSFQRAQRSAFAFILSSYLT
jgi:hypothetical protein